MSRHDRKDPFTGLRAVRPPQDLAERVMRAAADAAGNEPGLSIWDRLWHSTPLRVGWVVAVLLLALAHMTLERVPGSRSPQGSVAEVDELDEVFRLPEIEISPRAESIALGGKRKRNQDDRPDSDRENRRIDS